MGFDFSDAYCNMTENCSAATSYLLQYLENMHSADPNGHWCGVQRSFGGVNGRMQNNIPRCS